jgi:5-methylcytosine-specific restriction endonuclease McrA
MLDFQEQFVLKNMFLNNGKINLQIVTEEYKRSVSLDFTDILHAEKQMPRWMYLIRKAHHSLKDKGFLMGFELGEWTLTSEGFEKAEYLINSRTNSTKIVFYANQGVIEDALEKTLLTFETLYPINNIITDSIIYPIEGILVEDTNSTLRFEITKLELINSYVYLEVTRQEIVNEGFDSIKPDEYLEIYITNVVHASPLALISDQEEPPKTITSTVLRKIRDTALSQKLKQRYNHHCQICGTTITLGNGYHYAEAHHLKPLGNPHNGPDIESNLIVLCPNHHAEFDGKSIAINPESFLIEHIVNNNPHVNSSLKISLHTIDLKFIIYHYELFLLNLNK